MSLLECSAGFKELLGSSQHTKILHPSFIEAQLNSNRVSFPASSKAYTDAIIIQEMSNASPLKFDWPLYSNCDGSSLVVASSAVALVLAPNSKGPVSTTFHPRNTVTPSSSSMERNGRSLGRLHSRFPQAIPFAIPSSWDATPSTRALLGMEVIPHTMMRFVV